MLLTFKQDGSLRDLLSANGLYQAVHGYRLADVYDKVEFLEFCESLVSLCLWYPDAGRQGKARKGLA